MSVLAWGVKIIIILVSSLLLLFLSYVQPRFRLEKSWRGGYHDNVNIDNNLLISLMVMEF